MRIVKYTKQTEDFGFVYIYSKRVSDTMSTTMQAFVIVGGAKKQEEYLNSFKTAHNATSYLVTSYAEGFKISDARALQKSLSVKLQAHETRLVIISDPTLDSQNALLKTLEELPHSTFVIFCVKTKDMLLPTVLSRSCIVDLGVGNDNINLEILHEISSETFKVENIVSRFPAPTDSDIETLIITLRHALLLHLSSSETAIKILNVLKVLSSRFALSKSNNINKRMVLDSILYV